MFLKFIQKIDKLFVILAITFFYALFISFSLIKEPERVLFENKYGHDGLGESYKDIKSKRLIVILIDSLKPSYLFNEKYMPFVSSLKDNSAWGFAKVGGAPISVSCDNAIFCGYNEKSLFSIYTDFNAKTVKTDNVFKRLKESGKTCNLISTANLYDAFGAYARTCNMQLYSGFYEYEKGTEYIFEEAEKSFKDTECDFTVIQLCGLDYVGHIKTPISIEYDNLLKKIDGHIKKIIEHVRPSDTVLITSEHGMDDNSFHLEASQDVVNTPFIIFGPDIVRSGPYEMMQQDFAPTLSILLGIYPLYSNQSFPKLDILSIGQEYKDKLICEYAELCNLSKDKYNIESINELKRIQGGMESNKTNGIVAIVVSILLIACYEFFLSGVPKPFTGRHTILLYGYALLMVIILWGIKRLGIYDMVFAHLPFSFNFMKSSCLLISTILLFIVFLSHCLGKYLKEFSNLLWIPMLISPVFIMCSNNPYHLYCWLIIISLLSLWTINKDLKWFCLLLLFVSGLMIRRLGMHVDYLDLINNRMLILPALALVAFLFHLKFCSKNIIISFTTLVVVPLIISFLPLQSHFKIALIIIAYFISVRFNGECYAKVIVTALYITLILLAVTSSINNLTHVVVFPSLLLTAAIIKKYDDCSPVLKPFLLFIYLGMLYLLPGNNFTFMLSDLRDTEIMNMADENDIYRISIIIVGRYLFAIIGFYIVSKLMSKNDNRLVITVSIPFVVAAGLRYSTIMYYGSESYDWVEYQIILTLNIMFIILMISYYISSLTIRYAYKNWNLIPKNKPSI